MQLQQIQEQYLLRHPRQALRLPQEDASSLQGPLAGHLRALLRVLAQGAAELLQGWVHSWEAGQQQQLCQPQAAWLLHNREIQQMSLPVMPPR